MDEKIDGKNAGVGMEKVADAIKDTIHDGDYGDDDIVECSLSLQHSSNLHSSKMALLLCHQINLQLP